MDTKNCKIVLSRRNRAWLMLFCVMLNFYVPLAMAGPEGAQVVNGQAAFQQSGLNTTITASNQAIINYSSFNIGQPEVVQFVQPSSNASVLNRILSANPTNIDGTLLANGRVFFVNPAGVYIGAGAMINVNQLVASGLNISNSDFIDGRYSFAGGNGVVANRGDIVAQKAYLIGRQITNSGTINCPDGYVVMASGDRVFLGEPGSNLMVETDVPPSSEAIDRIEGAAILNEGSVEVGGGEIAFVAAGDVYSQAISNVGTLSASTDSGDAGRVSLTAVDGTVVNSGSIRAKSNSGRGGTVHMLGNRVGLFDSAQIDASGSTGGGTVLVGGDYQGQGDIPAASRTYLSSNSTIRADATENGDGGKVITWSKDITGFYGMISARGGTESGNGGFTEISSARSLISRGSIDLGATSGSAGTLLYDPLNIQITGGSTDGSDTEVGNSALVLQMAGGNAGEIFFADEGAGTPDPFLVYESEIENQDADIILQAGNSITVSGTFNESQVTLKNDRSLTMDTRNAVGDDSILLPAGIDLTGANVEFKTQGSGNITIRAGITGIGAGGAADTAPVTVGKLTTSGTGSILLEAEGDVTITNAVTADGSYYVNAGGDIKFQDGSISGSGNSTLQAAGSIDNEGSSSPTRIETTNGGDLYLGAVSAGRLDRQMTISSGGSLELNAPLGTDNLGAETILHANGDLDINKSIKAQSIEAHSGISGTGNLAFGPSVDLDAPTIILCAGDGTDGSTMVNLSTAPTFSSATNFTLEQDAALSDTEVKGIFDGGASPDSSSVYLSLTSYDSTLTFETDGIWKSITAAAHTDVVVNTALSTSDVTTPGTPGDDRADSGEIVIDAGGTLRGTGSLTTGDAVVDATQGGTDEATSGGITVTVSAVQLDGAMTTGSATVQDGSVDGQPGNGGGVSITAETGNIDHAKVVAFGSADLHAVGGNISEFDVTAGTTATLTANNGKIEDTDGATDITAQDVILTANSGIGAADHVINTQVANLEAETETGGIYITNTGALTIGNVDPALEGAQITGAGTDIDIKTSSPLTIAELVKGPGNIRLTAGGDTGDAADNLTLRADVRSTGSGATIGLRADDSIIQETGVVQIDNTDGGTIEATANNYNTAFAGSDFAKFTQTDGALFDSGGGAITVSSYGDAAITQLNAGTTGTVTVTSTAGSITDNTATTEAANILGSSAILSAFTGMGGSDAADIDTMVGTLEAKTTSVAGGDIVISETDALILADLEAIAGSIRLKAGGTIGSPSPAAPSTFTAEAGNVYIETSGSIINAEVDAGPLADLDAAGNIENAIVNASGNADLNAGVNIGASNVYAGPVASLSAGNNIEGTHASAGDVGMGAGNSILTSSANAGTTATLTANGEKISQFNVIAGTIATLTAINGKIEDTDNNTDITAQDAILTANSGIGSHADGDITPINTNVTSLNATTTTGDIVIVETDDVQLKDVKAEGGSVFLKATDGGMTYLSGEIKAGASTLTMVQSDPLDISQFTFENQGNTDLMLQSTGGSVTANSVTRPANAADQWKSIQAIANDNVVLDGSGDVKIGTHGGIDAVNHPFGGVVKSENGGVSIMSTNGTVRTHDRDTLDYITIAGTSDNTQAGANPRAQIGVELPGYEDGVGKAAIVIQSHDSLKIGTNATLTANGTYDPINSMTGAGSVDDRSAVGFKLDGDPIDAAIYIASTGPGNNGVPGVEISSGKITIDNTTGNGALAVRSDKSAGSAAGAVTFTTDFEQSLASTANTIKHLEVASPRTETLDWADYWDTLPHAGSADAFAQGKFEYVLRGGSDLRILERTRPASIAAPPITDTDKKIELSEPNISAVEEVNKQFPGFLRIYQANQWDDSLAYDTKENQKALEKLAKELLVELKIIQEGISASDANKINARAASGVEPVDFEHYLGRDENLRTWTTSVLNVATIGHLTLGHSVSDCVDKWIPRFLSKAKAKNISPENGVLMISQFLEFKLGALSHRRQS